MIQFAPNTEIQELSKHPQQNSRKGRKTSQRTLRHTYSPFTQSPIRLYCSSTSWLKKNCLFVFLCVYVCLTSTTLYLKYIIVSSHLHHNCVVPINFELQHYPIALANCYYYFPAYITYPILESQRVSPQNVGELVDLVDPAAANIMATSELQQYQLF